jgi:hypothetical protein
MQLWDYFNSGEPSPRSQLTSSSRQGWKNGWTAQWCQLQRLFEHIDSHALQADVEAAVRELDAERGDKGVPTFLYAWYRKDVAARAQANPGEKRRGGRPRGSKKQQQQAQPHRMHRLGATSIFLMVRFLHNPQQPNDHFR